MWEYSFAGRLAPEELKSCLVSVGYSIGKDRQGELDFQRILAVVDPNNTGKRQIHLIKTDLEVSITWTGILNIHDEVIQNASFQKTYTIFNRTLISSRDKEFYIGLQ